ncbi:MAG: zinc ABC transporter substrate-binding protein [Methanobacterium sp.]|nr:zinc ABC transporter substrate-binding protein [Methanobacterium sp.]
MNKHRIIIIFIIVFFIVIILFYLASLKAETTSNAMGIIVTVGPEMEFVKAVGGDNVYVTLMVPPGADPHTYEPLPDQLKYVANSKMYIEVGTPIEFELNYMDKMKEINPNMLVVNSSQGISLIPNTAEHENNSDPHLWVSPKNAKIMVENIYQGIIKLDPNNTAYYTKNRDNYLKQLDELNNNITDSLKNKENNQIIVYHPSWAYFCRDYNLIQIPIETGGKEPTSQIIASTIMLAKKNNIKVIFIEPQYSSKSEDVIASEINGKVVKIDDLAENYITNLNNVAKIFASV